MSTREVAQFLRVRERKIYDLVSQGRIPCTRVGGKWLFPRAQVEEWLARSGAAAPGANAAAPPPPVIAGSHDPLLEWCIAESCCGLALAGGGSLAGLEQLAQGKALACGMHVLDAASGEYNVPAVRRTLAERDIVVIEWAQREQGLVLAPGNPLEIDGVADLAARRARVVVRQAKAGTRLLLERLLEEAQVSPQSIQSLPLIAHTQTDVGLAVLDGCADAGLAIRAVARQLRLEFIPLHTERYDLVMRRRDYFEPPMQRLLTFARSPAAAAHADDLQGYSLAWLGSVHYNAT
jgi:putative molybdopterin biosynthesis protein